MLRERALFWRLRIATIRHSQAQFQFPMPTKSYNGVAWIYELLGNIYSGGRIYAAKASQTGEMRRGDEVLYAGVGPGEEAILAGKLGANVTCLDIAPKMLHQAATRFQAAGLQVCTICGDVMEHRLTQHYDIVVANFFLNVFTEEAMQSTLTHLATLVKPGGKLLIADFAAPNGGSFGRLLQATYWGVTNLFYYLLRLCAWHPIYDYPHYFEAAGLDCQSVRRFPLGRLGPRAIER
jgi:demethylphylloquinol methyltransferase